ncbi:MAG: ribosome small subunit-dependent GTPase A [Chloroflexi bacterium]|nr:ribosome small subunit-dependent GTPase A [Chloroflexota bacterium]
MTAEIDLGSLTAWGWDASLAEAFAPHAGRGGLPGRVVVEEHGSCLVMTPLGERLSGLAGRYRHDHVDDPLAYPGVGDWVVLEGAGEGLPIVDRLPRRTAIVRRQPGTRGANEQLLAANVDVLFIVASMNREFNIRRLERYVVVAWESRAEPYIVLSKSDLVADASGFVEAARAVAPGVPVMPVSAVTGAGLDTVRGRLGPGRTAAFVGSSGVGKSTLVNALAGQELMATASIREDDARGRHTTSRRQLLLLADGVVLDTPGLRELGLADAEGLEAAFSDIGALAERCRFRDCRHRAEPGCAIRAAIAAGDLPKERFSSYVRLEREAKAAVRRTDNAARIAEQRRWKNIAKSNRARAKALDRGWA